MLMAALLDKRQKRTLITYNGGVSHLVMSDSVTPMDCSLPGSSVHGILQARILKWVAIHFSKGFPDPGIEPESPALQVDSLPSDPTREAQINVSKT